jgi:hypothetical protein
VPSGLISHKLLLMDKLAFSAWLQITEVLKADMHNYHLSLTSARTKMFYEMWIDYPWHDQATDSDLSFHQCVKTIRNKYRYDHSIA